LLSLRAQFTLRALRPDGPHGACGPNRPYDAVVAVEAVAATDTGRAGRADVTLGSGGSCRTGEALKSLKALSTGLAILARLADDADAVLERSVQADVHVGLSGANVVGEARLVDDLRTLVATATGGDSDNDGRKTDDRQPDEQPRCLLQFGSFRMVACLRRYEPFPAVAMAQMSQFVSALLLRRRKRRAGAS
jgi:hypothetical protein